MIPTGTTRKLASSTTRTAYLDYLEIGRSTPSNHSGSKIVSFPRLLPKTTFTITRMGEMTCSRKAEAPMEVLALGGIPDLRGR